MALYFKVFAEAVPNFDFISTWVTAVVGCFEWMHSEVRLGIYLQQIEKTRANDRIRVGSQHIGCSCWKTEVASKMRQVELRSCVKGNIPEEEITIAFLIEGESGKCLLVC